MNVVYYSSDFFSEMCGVSIESLCYNNYSMNTIRVFIVEDNISPQNKDRLRKIVDKYNRTLEFIRMPKQEEVYPGIDINLGRTYARMALGEILPHDVERVLSLDSDTLIMDSLEDLYNVNFTEEEYVAGVYDCVGAAMQREILKTNDDLAYCNAGMFLIDLKKWRERNVGRKLLESVFENADGKHMMYFLEQDLMNLVFYKHLKLMHPRYNMLTSIYFFDYDEVIKMKHPVMYYSKELIEEAKQKPALLHATTCFYVQKRMWVSQSDHPYYPLYKKFRDRTDWKNDPEVQDERKFGKKVYAIFWHCIPRRVAVTLASFMINQVRPIYAKITTRMKISTIANQSAT